jgi:hypothetical protein
LLEGNDWKEIARKRIPFNVRKKRRKMTLCGPARPPNSTQELIFKTEKAMKISFNEIKSISIDRTRRGASNDIGSNPQAPNFSSENVSFQQSYVF